MLVHVRRARVPAGVSSAQEVELCVRGPGGRCRSAMATLPTDGIGQNVDLPDAPHRLSVRAHELPRKEHPVRMRSGPLPARSIVVVVTAVAMAVAGAVTVATT